VHDDRAVVGDAVQEIAHDPMGLRGDRDQNLAGCGAILERSIREESESGAIRPT
jgi:hypothetical protein